MLIIGDLLRRYSELDQGPDVPSTAKHARNVAPAALLADPTLAQLVCAWPNVPLPPLTDVQKTRQVPGEIPPHRMLRWLFAQLEPDPIPVWIEMAGLPDAPHVRRACFIAIDQRLVWPDGNISTWAQLFAKEALANAMRHSNERRAGL